MNSRRRNLRWFVTVTLSVYVVGYIGNGLFSSNCVTALSVGNNDNIHDESETKIDPSVIQAIKKCRSKIAEIDDIDHPSMYPKTRIRLALMLEFVSSSLGNDDHAEEIVYLYESAAANETLKSSEKIDAWINAAKYSPTSDEKLDRLRRALAVSPPPGLIDDDDKTGEMLAAMNNFAAAFRDYMHAMLQTYSALTQTERFHGGARETLDRKFALLGEGLELCDYTESNLCPKDPIVDEFRGVLLRKQYKGAGAGSSSAAMLLDADGSMGKFSRDQLSPDASIRVYDAYASAAMKSHSNVVRALFGTETIYGDIPPLGTSIEDSGELPHKFNHLCTDLLRYVLLAASSAREAGLTVEENEHILFGQKMLQRGDLTRYIDSAIKIDFWNTVGISFKTRGEAKKARQMFQKALEIDPEDGHAKVQLASLGDKGAAASTSLSADYVSGLFDGYSERFEQELVDLLDYTGHVMVGDALKKHVSNFPSTPWKMIDLGCGTGLLGSELREFSPPNSRLWGVDLSSRMVEHSRGRHVQTNNDQNDDRVQPVYDRVTEMDVVEYMKELQISDVTLIGASDVLIYIGDLNDLFRESSRVLMPKGLLSFTVEFPSVKDKAAKRYVDNQGVGLLESGRFGHSRSYIKQLADEYGYSLLEWTEGDLRKQGHDNVRGAAVVLEKES